MEKIKTIGDRIKLIREKSCLKNQEEFGRKIGLKQTTLSDKEKNKNYPDENTIKRICQEFNVNEEWLVNGIGEMYPTPSIEELDNLPDPTQEETEESEKIMKACAKKFGISVSIMDKLLNITLQDNAAIELFTKAMQGNEAAKKELMIKLLQK